MAANGQYLVTLGETLQSCASVAKILAESAESWKRTSEGLRYDEPKGIRLALEVHVNLLFDLSRELSNPGSTKYAPIAAAKADCRVDCGPCDGREASAEVVDGLVPRLGLEPRTN